MSEPGEEITPPRRSYSDAEAAADRAIYRALKRNAAVWSLFAVTVIGLALAHWFLIPALALIAGGACGAINALMVSRSGERLARTRSVGGFVLSSFLRIGLFGIVPVAFAARGPWWSMAGYFAGFFLPLAIFAFGARRAYERR